MKTVDPARHDRETAMIVLGAFSFLLAAGLAIHFWFAWFGPGPDCALVRQYKADPNVRLANPPAECGAEPDIYVLP